MSLSSAAGGASALYGIPWIMITAARDCARSSAMAMVLPPARGSVVGVLEVGVAAVVKGTDSLDAVRVDGGAPVRLHHDRDRLLDRLSLAQAHRALDRLDGGWRVARDVRCDAARRVHQLRLRMKLVDHAEPVGLGGVDRRAGQQHLQRLAGREYTREEDRRAAAGRQADHRLRLSERRVVGGDDEVRALCDLGAAAVRDAVDGCEDRLAQLPQRVQRAVEVLPLAQPLLLRHVLALAEVAADREGSLARAGDDRDAYGGLPGGGERADRESTRLNSR